MDQITKLEEGKDQIVAGPVKAVCGFTLRPMSCADMVTLMRLENPFWDLVVTAAKYSDATAEARKAALLEKLARPGETSQEADLRQFLGTLEVFYLFTIPASKARELLRKGGVALFRESAEQEIGDKLKLTQIVEMRNAVDEIFLGAIEGAASGSLT